MANSNGWGDGAANNSIGWGQGANNAIAWGDSHAKSWASATDIVGITTDPAASAYFASTGITGATQQTAIDNLVKGLKQDGLWSKMKAVYPFVTDQRNLASFSEDFSNAAWTKFNSTVTSNTTTAPNGTLTADTIAFSSSGTIQVTSIHNGTMTFSIYAKYIGTQWLFIENYNNSDLGAWFDIQNGVIGNIVSGVTANIQSVGNGWYRCSVTMSTTSSASSTYAAFNTNANGSFTRAGSSYFWGAQIEIGTLTTYQPQLGSAQSAIASQFKYNLVNPVDSDAAFRLVFNGGWTHSANGATPNGTNGFANTFLNASSVLTNNNYHLSHYSRTQKINANEIDLGADNGTASSTLAIDQYYVGVSGKAFVAGGYPTYSIIINNTDTLGLMVGTRTSSVSAKMFMDGSFLAQNTTANLGTLPNLRLYLSAINTASNVAAEYSAKQTAFASIGDGLTDTEAANLYTRVQAFQTALSRQV